MISGPQTDYLHDRTVTSITNALTSDGYAWHVERVNRFPITEANGTERAVSTIDFVIGSSTPYTHRVTVQVAVEDLRPREETS